MGPGQDVPGGSPDCYDTFVSCFSYEKNMSFPAISQNSGNSSLPPLSSGTSYYNLNVTWALPWLEGDYHGEITDTPTTWSVVIFSIAVNEQTPASDITATVTPRRTQNFRPSPGAKVRWETRERESNNLIALGESIVDSVGLATVPNVQIRVQGTRLTLIAESEPLQKIKDFILGRISLTPEQRAQLDANKDALIDVADIVTMLGNM
jgi:hypothetical protein